MTTKEVAVTAIIPVLTIVCSGVVSAIVTCKLNARRQERVFLRQKLEQLYQSAHDFCNLLGILAVQHLPVMKGKITYNQCLDLQIEGAKDDPRSTAWQTMTMLVGIYFSHLQPYIDKIDTLRSGLNSLFEEHKAEYKKGQLDGTEYIHPLQSLVMGLEKLDDEFKQAIVKEAQRI